MSLETASQRCLDTLLCAKRRSLTVSTSNPPPSAKLKAGLSLGANPRLSTRAVKLRKGNELHVSLRDELVSKWPDTAGAKGSHPLLPAGRGRAPAAGLWRGAGSEEGKWGLEGTDKDDSPTPRLNNTGRKKGRKRLCNGKARMYLPAPPRRGCGRYRKGTHAPPSPRSRSPTSAGRAPTGSGAGSARLRLPPAAAAAPAGSASPAPLVLPPPRPRSSLFSPGSVQAPSSLPARLLSLPRPPGSARFPGEPACSCRAAHIIAAPRTPPAALSRAPRTPGPSRPGSPADHGQIPLALSRFTAAPAVGVAAGPAARGGNPSVRLEPLLPRQDMPPPLAQAAPASPCPEPSQRQGPGAGTALWPHSSPKAPRAQYWDFDTLWMLKLSVERHLVPPRQQRLVPRAR